MDLSPHRSPLGWLVSLAGLLACGGGDVQVDDSIAEATNQAPVVSRLVLDPPDPLPGDTVHARVEAIDPDDDSVALVYDWFVDGEAAGDGTDRLRLPESRKGQQIRVRVIASDGRLDSDPSTRTAVVGDRAGTVLGLEIQPGHEVNAGETITVRANTRDPDGDVVATTHSWSVNDRVVPTSGERFDTTGLKRGDRIQVEVRVEDGGGHTLASPPIQIRNAPPRVVSRPVPPGADGFHYQVEASDPDGDQPLRFSLENPPPRHDDRGTHRRGPLASDARSGRTAPDRDPGRRRPRRSHLPPLRAPRRRSAPRVCFPELIPPALPSRCRDSDHRCPTPDSLPCPPNPRLARRRAGRSPCARTASP